MAGNKKDKFSPHIANRRAAHDYFIQAKLECGIVLLGSEVKSIREATAQIHEAFARVEDGELILYNAHIDPYTKGNAAHVPNRPRKLLAHRREIHKLEAELKQRGTTLVPTAIYFKDGRAKVEIGVARGKQQFDKRATIKKKEMDREVRRVMSRHKSG